MQWPNYLFDEADRHATTPTPPLATDHSSGERPRGKRQSEQLEVGRVGVGLGLGGGLLAALVSRLDLFLPVDYRISIYCAPLQDCVRFGT